VNRTSDGLNGLREVGLEVFQHTRHQSCWVHLSRHIGHLVRAKDKAGVLNDLKEVYEAKSKKEALDHLEQFRAKYQKHYPKAVQVLNHTDPLLSFYDFPASI
jgi:putative transposase